MFLYQHVGIKNANEKVRKKKKTQGKKKNASETKHSVIRPLVYLQYLVCNSVFMHQNKWPCGNVKIGFSINVSEGYFRSTRL